jgi:hypothetical protein
MTPIGDEYRGESFGGVAHPSTQSDAGEPFVAGATSEIGGCVGDGAADAVSAGVTGAALDVGGGVVGVSSVSPSTVHAVASPHSATAIESVAMENGRGRIEPLRSGRGRIAFT